MKQTFILFALLLTGTVTYAQADLSSIKNFSYSNKYSVTVNSVKRLVYENTESLQKRGWTEEQSNGIKKMSFVNFDLPQSGSAQVEIEMTDDFVTYDFRPVAGAAKLNISREGKKLRFDVDKPQQLVLRIDNSWDNVLCVFVNPYHQKPNPASVTYYFGDSAIHDYYKGSSNIIPNDPQNDIQVKEEVEAIVLNNGESLYIEEGAILRARIEVAKNAADVKIFGRGMMVFGLGHVENFSVISADGSRNERLKVEGITVVDAPGWILRMFSPANFTVDNFKTVGQWHFNTDGIQFAGQKGVIKNCFLQCNDDNFSMPSYIRDVDIQNMVLWNIFNGGAINFGWGNPNALNMNITDVTVIRSGDCCGPEFAGQNEVYRRKAPITMISYGGEKLENIKFENIIIEEVIKEGQWLHLKSDKAGDGYIQNITFNNVQVLNINKLWGLMKGSKTDGINNITFNNLKINGSYINSAAQAGLHMENTQVSTIYFNSDEPATELPKAPVNLQATLQNKINVLLTWADSSDNEFMFVIERKKGNAAWDSIGFAGQNTVSFTDADLEPGQTYCYRVFARNNIGVSANTNEACTTTDASLLGEILKNPDFESGTEKWEGYYTAITSINNPVYSGQNAVLVDHNGKWKGVKQDITTEIFKYANADSFYTEAWARSVSGVVEAYVNVMTETSTGQKKYHTTEHIMLNSTEWQKMSAYLKIDLQGISKVTWYVETPTDSQDDFIVDFCTMKSSELVSAIKKSSYNNDFSIFPNPAKNVINIHLANNRQLSSIAVFDLSGKQHLSIQNPESGSVDISGFAKGIYLVSVKDETGEVYIQKFHKTE